MKVAIIGLGQIGSKYDNSLKTSYSHRNSLLRHSKSFEKFYVDKDQLYLASISASDNAVSCVSISQLPNELDLVILSVPTELHLSCFLELIEKVNFKKLILEKPAGANLEESKIINDQASRLDIKVYVNYMRNTLPETQTIRNYIKSNQIKNFKADILVSGDLKNNGSHFLSLLVYLMGLNNMNIKDYEISQDSISFLYGENQIYLRKIPKVSFPFFSMMIFHPNGLIEYSEVQKLWRIFELNSSSSKILKSKQLFLHDSLEINLSLAQDYFLEYVLNELNPSSMKIDLNTANIIHEMLT